MKFNTKRRLGPFPEFLPTIGNPQKKYHITIADPFRTESFISSSYTKSFMAAPIYFRNITCSIDQNKIASNIITPFRTSNRDLLASPFFMVDDKMFYLCVGDRPINRCEGWIPAYSSFCTALFVYALRTSTSFIFDNCPIPVYPLPNIPDPVLPLYELELFGRSMSSVKDIPVFFHGRHVVRVARKGAAKHILRYIPGAYVGFTDNSAFLTSSEYINKMARSKIAWCPRSCWSPPDPDCNTSTAKECEAMCVETMVMKHSIGTTEVEKREPGVHFVEMKNDSSDMIEKMQYYLEHDDERKEIAHNGRLWYERNCTMSARMYFIINKCMESMGEIQNNTT